MNEQRIPVRGDTECPEPMFDQRIVYLIICYGYTRGASSYDRMRSLKRCTRQTRRNANTRHASSTIASFCKGTRAPQLYFLIYIPADTTVLHVCTRTHSIRFHSSALQSIPLNLVFAGRAYLSQQSAVVEGLVDELKRSTQQQKAAAGVGAPAQTSRIDLVDALTRAHSVKAKSAPAEAELLQ